MKSEQDMDMLVDDDEDTLNDNKYLMFKLGREVYGVNIADVTEIIEMQRITDVPAMPAFIKGVINLRGKVLPVMDLRLRFDMEERGHDDRTCIIIIGVEGRNFGLIVDTVTEVHDITPAEISPPPSFKSTASTTEQYISGLGKINDQVRILLDVKKILDEDELVQLEL